MIAMILWGQVRNKKGNVIKFFFPLLILYIILLPIYLLVLIVYLFFLVLSDENNEAVSYLKLFLNLPSIFHSMRDLEILVKNNENDIKLTIK